MGITIASRHDVGKQPDSQTDVGKQPDSQTWLYTFKRIEQNLGGVSKVGSGLGPNRWMNRWLSVTIASIQSLKKIGCTPFHFWKRSPGVVFLLIF